MPGPTAGHCFYHKAMQSILIKLTRSHRIRHIATIIVVGMCFISVGHGLTCSQISQFADAYVQLHYSAGTFDDELSRRTLDNFMKALDPGKMYFLQSDSEQFREVYADTLDDLLRMRDCSALNAILRTYAKRFKERQPKIHELIDSEHNFTVDEYYDVDRKKREYLETEAMLDERWRKQIKFQLLQLKKTFTDTEEVREKLHKRYELGEKYLKELDGTEVASIFLNAFSTALDPHSKYFSPDALEDFQISTGLSLEGIGAVLRSEYGLTSVAELLPGGPAKRGGKLKEGDKIIAVSQGSEGEPVDVVDMKLREVVKHIRGPRGTEVRLTVIREGKDKTTQLEIPIIRDKIELEDGAAKAYSYRVEVGDVADEARVYTVGLIRLPSFYIDFAARSGGDKDFKSSSADVRRLIEELKEEGIDSLVIDLRNNSGGSLDEAVNIAGLFFDHGPVVQVRDAHGRKQVLADRDDRSYYDGPLIVMINRQSASSSEILAGALQDYGRALIIGDSHSFGKGTVQKVNEVRQGQLGAMKVTINQFFRPGGASTQLRGVESDIVLPDIVDEYKIGEKFYDYVLPWNEIDEADFAHFDLVKPYIDKLRSSSKDRVNGEPDFLKIFENIDEYREKEGERTLISLKDEAETEPGSEEEEKEPEVAVEEGVVEPNGMAGDEDAALHKQERNKRPSLAKDVLLRETLSIAADYLQLLQGRELAKVRHPELEDVQLAQEDGESPDKVQIAQ